MKFIVNRKIMLEHLKTMIRIVPKTNPVQELTGFLIEANEDDGFLYMTATNLEATIQRKFKPQVETGGNFVMTAHLLVDILSLLSGDEVLFEETQKGTMVIKSDSCTYTMRVLDGARYPKPDIPFPSSVVHIADIRKFYTKTYAATAKSGSADVLKGIHFEIKKDKMKAVGCNLNTIALATKQMNCGGELSFTLTKEMLSYLSAAAGDSELEVGVCGNSVIFMKEGMLFSAKRLAQEYVNVDIIFDKLKTDYVATVGFDELKKHILNTCDISSMGSEASYIKFDFADDKIDMSTRNDTGNGVNTAKVTKTEGDSGKSYYYRQQALKEIFKTVEGTLVIRLDKSGYMVIMDQFNQYLLMPVPENMALKQLEKYEEVKTKKAKKVKTATEQKATEQKATETEQKAAA